MLCWNCQKELAEERPTIGFRDSCSFCSSDLHVCKNCKFYSPGKPNSCLVPGTEYISDREKSNLCEDFQLKTISEKSSFKNAEQCFGKNSLPKKRSFDDLFKD